MPAKALGQRCLGQPRRAGRIADVGLHDEAADAEAARLLGDLLGIRRAPDVMDGDVGAVLGQRPGRWRGRCRGSSR